MSRPLSPRALGAVRYLLEEIRTNPVPVPPAPAYPDKSFKGSKP